MEATYSAGGISMRNNRASRVVALAIALAAISAISARAEKPADGPAGWQARLRETLPLLGHRNWILVVDSAYPLQNSPGIEAIETGASQPQVLREVLDAINHSIHVRPVVFMDAELPFVPGPDAPGVSRYRDEVKAILENQPVTRLPHQQLLQKVDDISRNYKVLILKTSETIPYTSVFLQLNCKYWSDDAEARLRAAMTHAPEQSH
jgi:D-ribose pyranose/furanose isomerase RbsD